jgi:hypothetical protein
MRLQIGRSIQYAQQGMGICEVLSAPRSPWHYFQPVIDELISRPSNSYVGYPRNKMKLFAGKKLTESMEKVSAYRVQTTTEIDNMTCSV